MKNKHVESNFIVCLDEGSSPSDSTILTSTLVGVFLSKYKEAIIIIKINKPNIDKDLTRQPWFLLSFLRFALALLLILSIFLFIVFEIKKK